MRVVVSQRETNYMKFQCAFLLTTICAESIKNQNMIVSSFQLENKVKSIGVHRFTFES